MISAFRTGWSEWGRVGWAGVASTYQDTDLVTLVHGLRTLGFRFGGGLPVIFNDNLLNSYSYQHPAPALLG